MHAPASKSGEAHFTPGAHVGAETGGQLVCVCEKHTIPAAQSLSPLHGPGTHSLITVGLHGGGAGQGWPGAHAISGQPTQKLSWQVNPLMHSESWVQRVPACDVPENSTTAAVVPRANSEGCGKEVPRKQKMVMVVVAPWLPSQQP